MAGHELGEAVGDRDDGLVEIRVGHAGGAPQGARARHVAAAGGGVGAIGRHGEPLTAVVGRNGSGEYQSRRMH